tara:strand:+ start:236 stop:484 length:249 start_codon:yes stop_codon:yes gene_type:complete
MLIVNHTLVYPSDAKVTYEDHYQLADTYDEARKLVTNLISIHGDRLYCYAISDVLEASEPHWARKTDELSQTQSDDAWEADK